MYFQNKSTADGGLAVFLRNKFQGKTIQSISLQLPHMESLFLEVTGKVKYLVGVIYRPPNADIQDFMMSLEDVLDVITRTYGNTTCYIIGDFNINLLNNDNRVQNFTNLLYLHSYLPVITKPTRVTHHSATLLDHLWTNNLRGASPIF